MPAVLAAMDEAIFWQSGLGFVVVGLLLGIEVAIHRRGFAKPDTDNDDR